jgi:hypothetical protein
MKTALLTLGFIGLGIWGTVQASPNLDQARQMERAGDAWGAHTLLARAAQAAPEDVVALTEYAEFLDRYSDPECRQVYGKLLAAVRAGGDPARVSAVLGRMVVLDLLAGDRDRAMLDLESYRAAGGKDLVAPAAWHGPPAQAGERNTITIPGPLRSFARMAAFSAASAPEDILPALARNVVTNGFQASSGSDALEQTEYLKLVNRYLSQARELAKLAGPGQAIEIGSCESPKAGDLLRILGYRMHGGCGGEVVLETVNATRAFLTTDSGFPLPELEQALRTDRPFRYEYKPAAVPALFGAEYWLSSKDVGEDGFIDAFLADPSLCRLYVSLSKVDQETADALRKSVTFARLKAYAHVLDFFGGMFEIRGGRAVVPGGARSAAAWAELVGVSPDQGAAFLERLLARDDGWMASYFDALARIGGPVQEYLTEPARLKRFYSAIRGRVTTPGPARPVFRSNADMLLLTTRLRLDGDGRPHIPGSLEIWKNLFATRPPTRSDTRLQRAVASWKELGHQARDAVAAAFVLPRHGKRTIHKITLLSGR